MKYIQDVIFAGHQSDVVLKIAPQIEMELVMYLIYFHQRFLSYFLEAAFTVIWILCSDVCILRRFEDMKHYAENLGSNVAAMIKVRQVVYPSIVKLLSASPIAKRGEG